MARNSESVEALLFRDMTIDIEAARAAGIPVWVIATGSDSEATLRRAVPDHLLRRFRDILDLVPPTCPHEPHRRYKPHR